MRGHRGRATVGGRSACGVRVAGSGVLGGGKRVASNLRRSAVAWRSVRSARRKLERNGVARASIAEATPSYDGVLRAPVVRAEEAYDGVLRAPIVRVEEAAPSRAWAPAAPSYDAVAHVAATSPQLGIQPVRLAAQFAASYENRPLTRSMSYPGGARVDFQEVARALQPVAAANAAHRSRMLPSLENGDIVRHALRIYLACDRDCTGCLSWNNSEIQTFIASVFQTQGLSCALLEVRVRPSGGPTAPQRPPPVLQWRPRRAPSCGVAVGLAAHGVVQGGAEAGRTDLHMRIRGRCADPFAPGLVEICAATTSFKVVHRPCATPSRRRPNRPLVLTPRATLWSLSAPIRLGSPLRTDGRLHEGAAWAASVQQLFRSRALALSMW